MRNEYSHLNGLVANQAQAGTGKYANSLLASPTRRSNSKQIPKSRLGRKC